MGWGAGGQPGQGVVGRKEALGVEELDGQRLPGGAGLSARSPLGLGLFGGCGSCSGLPDRPRSSFAGLREGCSWVHDAAGHDPAEPLRRRIALGVSL